jgi:hypothetical protein
MDPRRPAPDGSMHWRSRKLARHLGVSHMMVARVWQRAGHKPHRIERYMASDDPDFELKATDIIGLYVKPPQHAAVFCVRRRKRPPSRPWTGSTRFCHCRRGDSSATALSTTATALFRCTPLNTQWRGGGQNRRAAHQPGVCCLPCRGGRQPAARQRDSSHCRQSLGPQDQAGGAIPCSSPQSASPLQPDLLLLAQSGRKLVRQDPSAMLSPGIFTSVKDLAHKLMRYIRHYNRAPKPLKWIYRDPSRRISRNTNITVTGH